MCRQQHNNTGCRIPGCVRLPGSLYEQRKHLCGHHIKADAIQLDGGVVRFCYRCGKLEPISCFDGLQRSCRARLRQRRVSRTLPLGEQLERCASGAGGGPAASASVGVGAGAGGSTCSNEPALESRSALAGLGAAAAAGDKCSAYYMAQLDQLLAEAPINLQPEPAAAPAPAPAAICCGDEDLDAALLQCVLEAELAEAGARAHSHQTCAAGGGSSASCSTLAPPAAALHAPAAVCLPAAPAAPASVPGSGVEVHAARIWAWHERLASLQEQCKAVRAQLQYMRGLGACPDGSSVVTAPRPPSPAWSGASTAAAGRW